MTPDTTIRIDVEVTDEGPNPIHVFVCPDCDEGKVEGCASHGGGCDVAHFGCRPSSEDCGECGGTGQRVRVGCECQECCDALEAHADRAAMARVARRLRWPIEQALSALKVAEERAEAEKATAYGYPGAYGAMRGGADVARKALGEVLAKMTEAAP